jgi:hypothetical protein
MAGAPQIRIRGAAELERAFLQLRREVLTEIKPALREIADAVRADAQQRAGAEISHIGPRWSRMRVGVTTKVVYVAPASRRRGGSPRPNLAGLLMNKAMQPALDAKQEAVMTRLDELINVSSARAGF